MAGGTSMSKVAGPKYFETPITTAGLMFASTDEQGALVRRESDRDFNNQIDLIEDFDTATGDRSRSVADLDSDGRADRLVLFRGADAVFVKSLPRRAPTSVARRTADAPVRRPPCPGAA